MKKLMLMLLLSGVSVQALEAAAGREPDIFLPASVVQELLAPQGTGGAIVLPASMRGVLASQGRPHRVVAGYEGGAASLLKGLSPLDADLIKAADSGEASEVARLINAGANINAHDEWGSTALINAAYRSSLSCVELLIRHGALINKQNSVGATALIAALDPSPVRRVTPSAGKTPDQDKAAIAQSLLDAGALPDVPDYKGRPPLFFVLLRKERKLVEMLLKAGASANFIFKNNDQGLATPLFYALTDLYEDFETAELLLSYGADPDVEVTAFTTTCLWLLSTGRLRADKPEEAIRLLLHYGADPNVVWNGGGRTITPLLGAVERNILEQAKLLLDAGANITPEVRAAARRNRFITSLIQKYLQRPSVKPNAAAADSKRDDQETKTIEELEAEVLGLTLESTSTKKSNKNTQAKSGKKKQTNKQHSKAAGAPVPDEVAATEPTPDSPRSDEEDGVAYLEMLEPEPIPAAGAAAGSADEEECPRASLYLSRAGVIDFNFLPAGGEEAGNAIAFGPATKHVMHKLCAFDSEEERGLTNFSEKRFDTAGGLLLVAPHIQDKFASLLRTRDGALDQDAVDHLVSTELMLKALRYGSCYLAVDTTAGVAKPCLLVVAPIERTLSAGLSEFASNAKNYLTLCFSIDYKGSINHCYHFCVQNKHPKQTKTEAGTAKYKLKPIAAKAKIRKRGAHYKLKLEFVRAEDFRNGAQELRGA